jgi:uncharacterized repeat protein (TIGR01451 family)
MSKKFQLFSIIFILLVIATIGIQGVASAKSGDGEWNSEKKLSTIDELRIANPAAVYTLVHPAFYHNYSDQNSILYLQNPNGTAANIELVFYGDNGDVITTINRQIAANWTLSLSAEEVTGLPEGFSSFTISSDQPVRSVVKTRRPASDKLAAYNGIVYDAGLLNNSPDTLYTSFFGPYFDQSSLILHNPGDSEATIQVDFYDSNGIIMDSTFEMIAPNDSLFTSGTILPSGFVGLAFVSSDQPVVGLLYQPNVYSNSSGHFEDSFNLDNALDYENTQAYLPRVSKHVNQGEGTRSTMLFTANTSTGPIDVDLSFITSNGTVDASFSQTLSSGGSWLLDLGDEPSLTDGMWAVSATATGDFAISEVSYYDNPLQAYGSSTYDTDEDNVNASLFALAQSNSHRSDKVQTTSATVFNNILPYIAYTQDTYTTFNLQNGSDVEATVAVSYYMSGTLIFEQYEIISPGGWAHFDQRSQQIGDLVGRFEVSAIISSDQPIYTIVDEYYTDFCDPVANIELARFPSGDIVTDIPVQFDASAAGTTPFTYTWTLDGNPVGSNSSLFEHTFTSEGTYSIGVTVDNACGQQSTSLDVTVQQAPANEPDLSTSYKSVNLTSIESGDILTYTLVLRNSNSVSATATLTDPIPANINYVSGSANASDGNEVVLLDGNLTWMGQVILGAPVIIQFAGEASDAPQGTIITNTARVNDGFGNETMLQAESVYDPGYRLTINDGALYTNIPTTTLRFSWNVDDDITSVKISNDGGFGSEGSTTDWLAVDATNPTYSDWVLSTYGDLQIPRTIYIKFRDSIGDQYGPFQDDIIYDPIAPQISNVEIIPDTSEQMSVVPGQSGSVVVRVTTNDDNSGVKSVQISDNVDFSSYSSFPINQSTTDILWNLQSSGMVYIRAVDRAGNLSAVSIERGNAREHIYLPTVLGNQS